MKEMQDKGVSMKVDRFSKYAWGVLAFNLAVIMFGAYVRASSSGAGCGAHWPLCNGEIIPRAPRIETLIEFTHRTTSGLAFLLVTGLLFFAWRAYPKGHQVRIGAAFSMLFMITEALVGAGLVLFRLVEYNDSFYRAFSIAIHLTNTFLLLASLSLTAWWASGGKPLNLRDNPAFTWLMGFGLLGLLILGASGAVTALGDTLFPSLSLSDALMQDFSPTAHFLIRLRVLHPTIAMAVGTYLILIASLTNLRIRKPSNHLFSRALTVLVVLQILAGVINVTLLAPIWMQIIHLFLSDALWIALVLLTATTLVSHETVVEKEPLPGSQLASSSKTG